MSKSILVVGATGVAGAAFVQCIQQRQAAGSCDWELIALSRQAATTDKAGTADDSGITHISGDLLGDHQALAALEHITHVVFAGFVPAPDFAQQVAPNRDILVNCLRALENNPLERITLIQGMKYYGSHLGPFKTPAREDDPRHPGENYYYSQQDVLEQSGLAWTCLRPHVICGTSSVGTPQNILTVLGVYAALMREAGQALHWPGSTKSFQCINQATDSQLLASAIAWSLNTPEAANEAFNITNGDFFRWESLWPKIAELFCMEDGGVRSQTLATHMPTLSSQWQAIVRRHGLKPYAMEAIAHWPFADYILNTGWDVMASTLKARQFGFQDCLDTEQLYVDHLLQMQALNILPTLDSEH